MLNSVKFTAALGAALLSINLNADPVGVVPGRILIKLKNGALPRAAADALTPFSGSEVAQMDGLNVHVAQIPAQGWQQALDQLNRNPNIEFAEPDFIREPDLVPNDTYYSSQWHLSKIQANSAWDSTTGSSSVTIAILDTGVESTHPDLAAQLVPGWNFYDNNSNTADVYGHGTAVAGTAAAASNNGIGVAGVAWGCKIMPIRISDTSGLAYDSTIATALKWAADQGCKVANISFGAADSATVQSAAQYFQSKGGVVTISSGNSSLFDSNPDNPYVLIVSATDSNDAIASFSNIGNNVDLSAPGVGIYTTHTGASYASWSGTSFSAPIVAGTAALVYSANPNLTATQVQNILKSSADDLGAPGYDTTFGYGRVNANRAVATAISMLPAPPPAPTPPPASPSTAPGYSGSAFGTSRLQSSVTSSSLTVAGANTMLVAVVGEYGTTINGVATSLGQNFTRLMQTNSWDTTGKAEIWYLPAPTAGAQSVTASFAGAVKEAAAICVMLVTNVGTITPGTVTYAGSGVRTTTIGPDGTKTTVNDLAGSGTIYFRTGMHWTPTGVGQVLRVMAENPINNTSALMSTMVAINGTTSLGYVTDSLGTEYADLAFTLSAPTTPSSPPPPPTSSSSATPGYVGSASGITRSGSFVASSSLTVSGMNTMLVAVVGEYGTSINGVTTSLGQSFTRLMQTNSWDTTGKAEIWYLPAPSAGAQTVTATFAGAVKEAAAICVMLVTNVGTITPGSTTFRGSGQRSTSVGPDGTQTTVNDLAGTGTIYFRSGLHWTPTGVGQVLQVMAENPVDNTSALMSTMTAISGTTSLGYVTDGSGTEYADLAFTLSPPSGGTSPAPGYSAAPPGFSTGASGISSLAGSVTSSPLTVSGANPMLVAVVGEYGTTVSGVATSLGQNFTRLMQTNSWDTTGKAEIWYLPLPTAGTQSVKASFSASTREAAAICVMLVTNVATITPGSITYRGSGLRTIYIGPDGTQTTQRDLAGSGTIYFRTGLHWTPTGVGQVLRVMAENPVDKTSALMSSMTAVTGTTSLGYTTDGSGSEYADLAFTLSHP